MHCASSDSRYSELSFFIALRGKQEAKSAVMSEVDTPDSVGTSGEMVAVPPPPANLPPPKPLIMDDNLATSWKQWRKIRYEIATGITNQDGLVRVATLLSVTDEDAVKVYDTFTWLAGENEQCIDQVL